MAPASTLNFVGKINNIDVPQFEVIIEPMVKERGVIMPVWRAFVASLKPRMSRQKLMGEDYNGTKYYEDPEARQNRGRTFVPVNEDDFMQDIPAEWEAWLRYRRHEPPTVEEIHANLSLMMTKKKNAGELEDIRAAEIKKKYGSEGKPLEKVDEKAAFPSYDDYKNFGQNYQFKKK